MAQIVARATNQQSTEETFILRKLYKDRAFPTYGAKSIDFWYEKPMYGRIDSQENAVAPKSSMVKQIPSSESSHFALNFVTDAFIGMRNAFAKGMMAGNVATKGSIYSGLPLRQGIESASNTYYNYLQIINDAFISSYLDVNNKINETTDFDSFFLNYVRYLYDRASFIPITKSSFLTSRYATPYMSGLMIEVGRNDHSIDQPKREIYIEDPNFEVFRNTAQQYGFMVDKNAPWRLTADLSSPFMQRFGEPYGVEQAPGTASNIFDTHYDRVYNDDIRNLKRFFKASYEVFAQKYPIISEQKLSVCGVTPSLDTNKKIRPSFNEDAFENKYNDAFWIQLYYNLRMREIKIPLTTPRRRVMIKEMVDLLPFLGLERVASLVNDKVVSMNPDRWWSWSPNSTSTVEREAETPAETQQENNLF